MQALSEDFLTAGTQASVYELVMMSVASGCGPRPTQPRTSAPTGISRPWTPCTRPTRRAGPAARPGSAGQMLSPREREVLALVAIGETGQTIAAELRISPATVETYIRNCLAKLGAKNRPHAVVLALKRGDISLT